MTFHVAKECIDLGLRAGAIVFRNVHIADASPALRAEAAQAVEDFKTRFADAHAGRASRQVTAYHDILRAVGANPRREPPSVDKLLTLALKRGHLPVLNNLVDAYNLISLRSLCSLGAHDLDLLALPVELRLLTGSETFTPIGRDQPQTVSPGEFGYVDAKSRVLCRLDVIQADFSKVTAATRNALLIIEGNSTHSPEFLGQVFQETIDLVTRHCGGTGEIVAMPASDLVS
jgi:DNA/RNA-binding domain of Phe-tRNA-synthetase-like protein